VLRDIVEKSALLKSVEKDEGTDAIGLLCKRMSERETWNAEFREVAEKLALILKQEKYYFFEGDPYRYGLTRIGESYLINVSDKQRGHLEKYRGLKIRLVCIGSGRFKRSYASKLV